MLFWFTSLLTCFTFFGILVYLAFFNETLDSFFKVSLLFTLYFLVQSLPYITEIKQKAPMIFNVLIILLSSWLYLIIPPIIIEYYAYIILSIGPLYIIVEAAQSVGLSIIIGEKVADWLSGVSDNFASDYDQDRERYGCRCRCREQFALSMVAIIYGITFLILFKVFMCDSTDNWPISVYWVFGWIFIGMILIFIAAIQCRSGTVVQTSLISLFLSYIIYSSSQLTTKDNNNNNLSDNTTNLLLQCAVVLIILLSIPPTMHDLDEMEINKIKNNYERKEDYLKYEEKAIQIQGIFGKSTRLESVIMAIIILLLTHLIQIWIDFKSLSINLFWYRMGEALLSVLLYLFVMFREQNTANYMEQDI